MHQSINHSINQTISHSINQTIHQSINPINQTIEQLIHSPIHEMISPGNMGHCFTIIFRNHKTCSPKSPPGAMLHPVSSLCSGLGEEETRNTQNANTCFRELHTTTACTKSLQSKSRADAAKGWRQLARKHKFPQRREEHPN